jgi:hypothetical protein
MSTTSRSTFAKGPEDRGKELAEGGKGRDWAHRPQGQGREARGERRGLEARLETEYSEADVPQLASTSMKGGEAVAWHG